jgi:hypothetical protein
LNDINMRRSGMGVRFEQSCWYDWRRCIGGGDGGGVSSSSSS